MEFWGSCEVPFRLIYGRFRVDTSIRANHMGIQRLGKGSLPRVRLVISSPPDLFQEFRVGAGDVWLFLFGVPGPASS